MVEHIERALDELEVMLRIDGGEGVPTTVAE